MKLHIADLRVDIRSTTIVSSADVIVEEGQFAAIVGPNGSGKSTLLRTIYRALQPASGLVTVGDDDVWSLPAREAARRTAVVAQEVATTFDFTALEIVQMGRNPHKGPLERESAEDRNLCIEALRRVGLAGVAKRSFTSLSGGEKQRVHIARALAQQSKLLVLDEPTNHLDIRYQLELLHTVRELGITTIAAMHDLGLAAQHCDLLYVIHGGMVVAAGAPADVLTPELVSDVFGVQLRTWTDADTGSTHFSFDRISPTTPTNGTPDGRPSLPTFSER